MFMFKGHDERLPDTFLLKKSAVTIRVEPYITIMVTAIMMQPVRRLMQHKNFFSILLII